MKPYIIFLYPLFVFSPCFAAQVAEQGGPISVHYQEVYALEGKQDLAAKAWLLVGKYDPDSLHKRVDE